MHGSGGQGRSAKQVEEYNNIYVFDAAGTAGEIRGGTIISHDNTWTNVARGHILQDFRYYSGQDTYWGIANGQNVYDLNAPNGTASYWVAGTHTGPNGADSLTDATKNWTTNQWYTPTLGAGQRTIKEGRDFFNNTPKPGYTPYTYPHPLTGPLPPTNLQIAAQP